jgi:hypothetical protein
MRELRLLSREPEGTIPPLPQLDDAVAGELVGVGRVEGETERRATYTALKDGGVPTELRLYAEGAMRSATANGVSELRHGRGW